MKKESKIENKPCCPKCRHTGFWQAIPLENQYWNKPHFQCDKCNNIWSSGPYGGRFTSTTMGARELK